MRNRHAGILRWLSDRRRAERRASIAARGTARERPHRVLAEQIESAMRDLERVGEQSASDGGVDDAHGSRAGVESGQDSSETSKEET